MTLRPRASPTARTPRRSARKPAKPAKTWSEDPLDAFIVAGARALGVKIEKSWLPAVRINLDVTLRLGGLVAEFPLPDEAEPAPVFRA